MFREGIGLRRWLLQVGDRVFGHGMTQRLKYLQRVQWFSKDQLASMRNQKLKALATTAYLEVPFYRQLFDQAGLSPDAIREPVDLRQLPIVTKAMLKASYPEGTRRATGYRTFENRSSGSTGTNFAVLCDMETAGWYRASFMLALDWAGWQIGEPHVQTGINPQRSFSRKLKDRLLRCTYVSVFDLDEATADRTLVLMDQRRIKHLWGYPGALYVLAQRAILNGWNTALESIVTWGDNLYPHYRDLIQKAFGSSIYDTYGCGEGIQIAAQCGQGSHYHTHDLDVIVEYVDSQGVAVPDGEPGNLILTRLHAGPMPLIRYQVGDRGVSGGHCQCGRGFGIMDRIEGRDTDIITTPSGKRLVVHFFTGILEHIDSIDSYQVHQPERNRLIIRLVPGTGFDDDQAQRIEAALREKGIDDMTLDLELMEHIPTPPSGKRRFVTSALARPFAQSTVNLSDTGTSTNETHS